MISEIDFDLFEKVIRELEDFYYIFVNNDFMEYIKIVLKNLYPKLNNEDLNVLSLFTGYLIDYLSSEKTSFSTGAVFDLSGGRATY